MAAPISNQNPNQPKAVNMKRSCFKCQDVVYLNPNIRKKEDQTKFEPLNEPFDENKATATTPPKFHKDTCPYLKGYQSKPYNYEGEPEQNWPDSHQRNPPSRPQLFDEKPVPAHAKPNLKRQEVALIPKGEFEELKSDVSYIKQLLEAMIKALDKSNNGGLLFTSARDMVEIKKTSEGKLTTDPEKAEKKENEEKKLDGELDEVTQVEQKEATTTKTTKPRPKSGPVGFDMDRENEDCGEFFEGPTNF